MNQLFVTLLALAGTLLQAHEAFLQLHDHKSLPAWQTLDDFHLEVPRRRPFARRKHRKVLKDLMRENPAEAAAYRRIRRVLWSWALLACAALAAVAQSVV